MSHDPPLVCLVTPGHLASTPRLVKEADALADEGYRVHVVAGRHFGGAEAFDAEILARARWTCTRIQYRGPGAFLRKISGRLARRLVTRSSFATVSTAARANHSQSMHLAAVAAKTGARLFIGHCIPGLAAAARAAKMTGSTYGFDAEDFHDAETMAVINDPAERASVRLLQSNLLAGCGHLTAASPLISRQYEESYAVRPRTLLNVFPLALAPSVPVDPAEISESRPAVAYWFSQTIGPGRGLEEAVAVLARMATPVELHLRGFPAEGFPEHLQELAGTAGLRRPIRFREPGPPDEMARLAAGADLGLSTEIRTPPNRNLCLTNKIFVYLLAGIPQLLSDTAAQSSLAPDLSEAALLGNLSDAGRVAGMLDEFLGSPTRVAAARRKAWELGHSRYCWDFEKSAFLESVRIAVPRG